MSLSNQIIQQLQNTIEMYINNISDKYNINKNELTELWSGNKQPVSKPIIEINMDDLSIGRLMKCTNKELSALCKSHGKKSTGKKDELIARLTEKEDPTKQVNTPTTKKVETESKLNTSKTKKLETESKKSTPVPVLQKISSLIVAVRTECRISFLVR